jgi:hypothetical protein
MDECVENVTVLFQLSISEYRKRKQQSSVCTATEPESLNETTGNKSAARGRSDSASSGTSSVSSDEEGSKVSLSLDLPGLATLTPFANAVENDEKKGDNHNMVNKISSCLFHISLININLALVTQL